MARMSEQDFSTRQHFGDPDGVPPCRPQAERESKEDLQKPIWQLVCDIHEEVLNKTRSMEINLPFAIRRLGSMFGRVALQHEADHAELVQLTRRIDRLTVAVVRLTIMLVILTVALVAFSVWPLFHHVQ
jgi:hypothetical protein